jgi:hypothetical protein
MSLLGPGNYRYGDGWLRELKLEGYRCLAIKTGGKREMRSPNKRLQRPPPAITKTPFLPLCCEEKGHGVHSDGYRTIGFSNFQIITIRSFLNGVKKSRVYRVEHLGA